jgi:putrescine transport system substrate-binding protein
MRWGRLLAVTILCVSTSFIIGCGNSESDARNGHTDGKNDGQKVLNLFIWSDFLAPDTIASFEKSTEIKVRVSYFDNNEMLEGRMLTGNSGFDVVFPSAPPFQRQIRSGAYLPLDKKKLPNLVNLDPVLMSRVALNDPGNVHGVVYMWGTDGIGYNAKMVASALPNVPLNSWRLIFDPAFASKLATCGINIFDAPTEMVRLVRRVTESWGCAMQRGSSLAAGGDLDTSVRSSHANRH